MSADVAPGLSVDAVVRKGQAPAPAGVVESILTHGWRALLKIKHVPFQLFDVTAMPIMMTLLFTYLFGGALEGSTAEYIKFLAPGILVQTVTFTTVYTGVAVNTDIKKGLHDRFRSLPNWQPSPVMGMLAGDLFRYTMSSIVVLTVAIIIGFRPDPLGALTAMALILLFALSVSWLWTIAGLMVRTPESVMTMSFLVIFPLTFISNIFVRPETMPGWLQAIVKINPITHLATASRELMRGEFWPIEALWVLIASVVIAGVFAPVAMRMYRRER